MRTVFIVLAGVAISAMLSGATTLMEMLIVYRKASQLLAAKGIKLVNGMADEILTVQEQAGFQLNIAKWDDVTLARWNTPAHTIAFNK